MKGIFRGLCGKRRGDDRGLTFVEVMCAVAILALISGVIGTVLVMSTRTYRRGLSETGIQQAAQLAANNIGNLVKDACSVVYGASGEQYLENGEKLMTNADATPKMQTVGTTELSIITNEKLQYTITYDKLKTTLLYQEFNISGASPSPIQLNQQVMAENISEFTADTTDFKKSKTIKLKMTVLDAFTNRSIPMEYTMTSRNDAMEGAVYKRVEVPVSIVFPEEPVLVPGETYNIPINVSGKLTEGLEIASENNVTVTPFTGIPDKIKVKVADTAEDTGSFTIRTKEKDSTGAYKAVATCNIKIRRVNKVQVSHSIKTSTNGMRERAGTVYTFNAYVTGTNLEKQLAYDYDQNYKIAQSVTWSVMMKADGVTYDKRDEFTYVQDADGKWSFNHADFNKRDGNKFEEYFGLYNWEIPKEDVLVPLLKLELKKDMPADLELTVRATSKHALGANKANSQYGDRNDTEYYGEDTIKPRPTLVHKGLEITLEPYETGTVEIDMMGGYHPAVGDVTFVMHDAKDGFEATSNPYGTKAEYVKASGADKDKVKITLGKNETGSGPTGAEPYTFTIDVLVKGKKMPEKAVPEITVHVVRVDKLSIQVFDNFKNDKGETMATPSYDFRARFNSSSGTIDQEAMKYLIQYKTDGTPDADIVKNTLASRITWELIDHGADGKGNTVLKRDSVICLSGVVPEDKVNDKDKSVYTKVIGTYTAEYKVGNEVYYNIISVKPARVEPVTVLDNASKKLIIQKDADGNTLWQIKQLPEIDVSPNANTSTGMKPNHEFKVKIEALHPLGVSDAPNKTAKAYGVAEAEASIEGGVEIKAPVEVVYVEPGQGTNDKAASEREMVVPIEVYGGGVYEMEAAIDGNSSSNTKLCVYSDSSNPYMASKATSSGNMRIWNLGLLIGEDEKGRDNTGLIDVKVTAYGTKNSAGEKKVLINKKFQLAVRRVNEVDVKLRGKAIANMPNGTVTLDASPKGYGTGGTQYFPIQRYEENGEVCLWEQKGHGEYKEPYPMEWRLVIDDKEKPLEEWTEYIDTQEGAKPKTATIPGEHKATVTFKLKKELPIGAKIRAYSLHARGNDKGVDYNKSGKKYGDVYGELEIKNLLADTGFQRADEFTFVENISNMRQGFGDEVYASEQCSFFRYRIKDGTWTPYYQLEDKSPQVAKFSGIKESLVFLPDKDYDVEIINVVYSKDKKLIYWPLDETLLEDGKGWKEEGFRLWNGDEIMKNSEYQGNYKNQMIGKEHQLYNEIKSSKEQWRWVFYVPEISINFAVGNARQWNTKDTSVTLDNMSETSPIHLQGGSENTWTSMDEIAVELVPTSFCLWKKQYNMNAYVDQKINGEWKEVAVTNGGWDAPRPQPNNITSNQNYWHLQTSCPQFQIYQVYSGSSAEYRIRTMIKDMEWMNIEGRLFDRTYVGYKLDTPLFDMSSGAGVLYLKFN